jgi:hypothetical protein
VASSPHLQPRLRALLAAPLRSYHPSRCRGCAPCWRRWWGHRATTRPSGAPSLQPHPHTPATPCVHLLCTSHAIWSCLTPRDDPPPQARPASRQGRDHVAAPLRRQVRYLVIAPVETTLPLIRTLALALTLTLYSLTKAGGAAGRRCGGTLRCSRRSLRAPAGGSSNLEQLRVTERVTQRVTKKGEERTKYGN